jgi:hypothetical protein
MSQVLKEMPTWAEDVDSLGRPAKYPWRDWLDGETHLLVRTTDEYEGDYQTESRFFRHTVIRAAEKRNIDVFVAVHSGRNYEDKRDRMIIKANGLAAGLDAEPAVPGALVFTASKDPIDRVLRDNSVR